ncbi:hypothetical protein RB195_009592 [Necator americanus]|uniref:Uncharacterized protein n=1 Tax=Necator americanus TaxID=51031 RepID=A0ABR1CUJ2_NECAM
MSSVGLYAEKQGRHTSAKMRIIASGDDISPPVKSLSKEFLAALVKEDVLENLSDRASSALKKGNKRRCCWWQRSRSCDSFVLLAAAVKLII